MPLPLEEVMQKVHGINEEILTRLFGDQLTPAERKQHSFDKEARYRELFKDSLALIDGLDGFFQSLRNRGVKLAVGSAAPPENVDFVLDNLSIRSLLEIVLHARHVKKGKPDPEIYLKIMDQLSVKPEECIVFEDSPVGAEAVERSGAKVVVITTTHDPQEFAHLSQIIGFVEDFTELQMS